jgi:hypothetical protein
MKPIIYLERQETFIKLTNMQKEKRKKVRHVHNMQHTKNRKYIFMLSQAMP